MAGIWNELQKQNFYAEIKPVAIMKIQNLDIHKNHKTVSLKARH
jgi:hypothetical protein